MSNLDKLFSPKSIAVIGASNDKSKAGYSLVRNMIGSEYEGVVFPVNRKRKSVLGVKAYPSIINIEESIDLAIIVTPAKTVPAVMRECGEKKVGGVVIISAGFSEAGKEGEALNREVLQIAKEHKIRILGPNCLGFIRPKLKLNASFSNKITKPGRVAFISQSGALCTAILDWAVDKNISFNYFVSIGSMADLGFHDLIDYFGSDPETSSILIYMESLTDARKFISAARAFSRTKPIIVLKVGRSEEGAQAAMSHTGSLTGNDAVYDAIFKRAGITRVDTISDLFDSAQTLAMQPKPKGDRLGIITNAGGPGVISTDALIKGQGRLAKLDSRTIEELNKHLPAAWSKGNPVDVLGDADSTRYREALKICLKDKNLDGILIILTPQAMTNPTAVATELVELLSKIKTDKTILASWMGSSDTIEGMKILEQANIPVYSVPENAVRCFMYMYNYTKNLELLYETPASTPHAFKPNTGKNKTLIKSVIDSGRNSLTEEESKELLSNYGIPVSKYAIAKTEREAVTIAKKIGFPLVMKISSADILHKTDIGGVILNVNSQQEAKKAFNSIISRSKKNAPKANIDGVFIEKMVNKKYELLIGCKKDPLFGPVIVFGMGGVAVEIFKDTNVGIPPLNMALAMRIIEDTKIYKLLKGYRGMPGTDISAIQFLLYKFAYLVADFPEIEELDINPFSVDSDGGVVLDAKVVLDKNYKADPTNPYSHLAISPYPRQYNTNFKLKNGKNVVLRAIKPEDEYLEKGLFESFSAETHKHRFFQVIKDINHDLLTRFTQIDYDREIAIIALLKERGKEKMIGVVRLISDSDSTTAEFAIAIGDPWQHEGLGKKFTDYILKIAQDRGIKKVWGKFLENNTLMKKILEKKNFTFTNKKGIVTALLELPDN